MNHHQFLKGESTATSIPFLFASYPFLWSSNFRNNHYSAEEVHGKNLDIMWKSVRERKDPFVAGSRLKELLFESSIGSRVLPSSDSSICLDLTCDIDSIDVFSNT